MFPTRSAPTSSGEGEAASSRRRCPEHPQSLLHDRGRARPRDGRGGRSDLLPGIALRGHALYISGGRLKYVYNWVGERVQVVEADAPLPTGHAVVSALFEKENDGLPAQGTLALHVREEAVGAAQIMTQPGEFGLGGGGLIVGRSGAEPVTDYAGARPWPFLGGTIKRVMIDVSGEPFVDLAREARAAFAHQ